MTAIRSRTAPRRLPLFGRLRVVLAAGLVLGLGATSTVATWTDSERVTASFEAGVVPAPRLTQACRFVPGVLGIGARVRVFWALPEGYTLSDVRVEASTRGLGSVLAPLTGFSLTANTQRQSDGTYRTDVPTNLLGGLLGLGSELEIAFRVVDGGWESTRASVASNAGLIGGIGGNCRNLS
ncbi:SipW-dependent-type signal peptide-containing protein [Brachybacterium sp. YJGR34]|uniref:SipW-dependent-type signal peptide-containing protein n=1 Tax=Brachybacterium sp. YJGR34 TaxID=2059911 RepID=UPI000E0B5E7B|nr:SipW-dependent-type signal peptide-containing protein [Brachybacterium sp. YJGR34]